MKTFEVGKSYAINNAYQHGTITVEKRTAKFLTYTYCGLTFKSAIRTDGDCEYILVAKSKSVECKAADVETSASEAATPDAPQEAANDEQGADATDSEQKPAPEFNYDFLSGRYAIFEYADGTFSNEYETDDLKEARERLKEEWEGSLESGAFAIFDRDARQYIQIRATSKGRKAFKAENERLTEKAATPVNQTEDSAEAGQPAPQKGAADSVNDKILEAAMEFLEAKMYRMDGFDELFHLMEVCEAVDVSIVDVIAVEKSILRHFVKLYGIDGWSAYYTRRLRQSRVGQPPRQRAERRKPT